MASPEELARLKGNPQTGAVNMPGVDPITASSSFQPGGPPDPGKQIRPEITLPDQQIGPGTGNLQIAGEAPAAFPGNPPNPAQAEIEAHPPEPVEEPTQFNSAPLNPIQQLDADSKAYGRIADTRKAEGKAIAQGKMDEATIHSQSAQEQELRLKTSNADMAKAKAAADLSIKDINAKIANAEKMQIDPDRYWKRKGTASNIMAAIAIGLGSFGSGLTGGATGNPALTLINAAIEHDIDAQKSDIDNYWKVIKEQKGLVDDAWNRELVMQNYNANAMLTGWKIAESKLKAAGAKTDSAVVKAQTDRLIAEMQPAINAESGRIWSTLAALEAERKKQQMAGQAAVAANRAAVVKERNKAFESLRDQNMKAGMDIKEASAQAWADTDDMYPQIAGTQFASPGQKYQDAVSQAEKVAKQAVALGKNMTEDQIITAMLVKDPKLSPDEVRIMAKMAKTGDVDGLTVKTLNHAGISDPYKGATSTTDTTTKVIDINTLPKHKKELAVVDPNTGEVLMFPTKEAAQKARDMAAGAAELANLADQAEEMRTANDGGTIDGTQTGQGDILRRQAVGAVNASHGGALQQGELDDWNKKIPSPTDYSLPGRGDVGERWKLIKESNNQGTSARMRAMGGTPVGKSASAATAPKKEVNTSGDPATARGKKPQPFTPVNPVKDPDKQSAGKRNY